MSIEDVNGSDGGADAWGQVATALGRRPPAAPPVPVAWAQVARALAPESAVAHTAPVPSARTSAGWATVGAALNLRDTDVAVDATASTERTRTGTHTAVGDSTAGADAPATMDRPAPVRVRRVPRNPRSRRRLLPALVAVVVLAVVAAGGIWAALASGGHGLPRGAVASVQGVTVTKAQLDAEIDLLDQFYGITPPATADKAAHAGFEQTSAKALVIDQVLATAAARLHVSVTTQEAQADVNQLVTSSTGGNQTEFDQLLSDHGLTEAQLLDETRRQLLERKLYNRIGGTVTVSPAQIDRAFQANRATLAAPQVRAISHILVANQTSAETVLSKLAHGAHFATLAAQDSLDTVTKAKGGSLGRFAASQLSAAFAQAAFAASLNKPFGPIAEGTGSDYDIGLVTAITPGHAAVDDAATQSILRSYLTAQTQSSRWATWLGGQLRASKARYAAGYRPAQPDAPPANPATPLSTLVAEAATGSSTAG